MTIIPKETTVLSLATIFNYMLEVSQKLRELHAHAPKQTVIDSALIVHTLAQVMKNLLAKKTLRKEIPQSTLNDWRTQQLDTVIDNIQFVDKTLHENQEAYDYFSCDVTLRDLHELKRLMMS